jgi:predicted lipoprotein with Yx(FWY)xxD motif
MTHDTRASKLVAALFATVAIVAACSSSGGGASSAPSAAAPSASASEAPASEAPSAAAGAEIKLADSSLGQIIVDAEGKTLYMFTPDEAGTPTCYDQCATAWPPLTGEVTAGAGLDASKLTVVDRTDGSKQVKYGNWPLYYFANDAAAGDVKGQGLNDKWYVVGADGEPIKG